MPLPEISTPPTPALTANDLVRWTGQLSRFLAVREFDGYVAERAVDRVLQAGLRYLPGGDREACPLRNPTSWVFGIGLKIARQVASRDPAVTVTDPSNLAWAPAPAADDELAEAVWAAMDRLTEPQRQAVYLNVMCGLTLTETAIRMGSSPTTVQRHRVRGVRKLRLLLSTAPALENTPVH